MKKIILTITLLISIATNSLSAYSVDEFANDVGYTIFKIAWPTATYKNIEVLDQKSTSNGYMIIFKFNGDSNLCSGDTFCSLWFKLKMNLDNDFNIQDMEVLSHNAFFSRPFKTVGAIGQAMNDANSR